MAQRLLAAMVAFALGAAAEPDALPAGDWAAHGLAAEGREAIRDVFRQAVERKIVPGGALLLVHKGEVVLREAFGLADVETKRPFTTDALCFIASLTKPHTATLMVMLAERGKLSLDEPVDTCLPAFKGLKVRGGGPVARAPTLRQGLCHTAGFPGNRAIKSGAFTVNFDGTLADAMADLASRQLAAAPGTRHAYSRFGYMMAARAAEVRCGKPFPRLLREVLLDPIGAKQTTFEPSPDARRRVPTPYDRVRDGFRRRDGQGLGRAINPGGGLYATLDDVGRLLLLHRNKGRVGDERIVSEKALAEMYVAQPATPGTGYGLGFNVLRKGPGGRGRRVRHLGGSGTLAVIDFDLDLIIVLFTQVHQQQILRFRQRLLKAIDDAFAD